MKRSNGLFAHAVLALGLAIGLVSCDDSLPGTPPVVIPPGPNGNILYAAANPSDPDKSELLLIDSNGIQRGSLGPGFIFSKPGNSEAAWTIFRGLLSTELWAGPTVSGGGSQVSPSINSNEIIVHGSAAISPDGSKVAFTTVNIIDGSTKLYYYTETNGVAPTPNLIALDIAFNSVAAFSPDGRKIAFFTQKIGTDLEPIYGTQGFVVADISTSNPIIDDISDQLPDFEIEGLESIDWSPDNRELLFSVGEIQYLYPIGSTVSISSYIHGTYSPDGNRIAYISNDGQLYVEDRVGINGRTRLTESPDSVALYPSWSPDGKKIVFTSVAAADIADPDGSIKIVDVTIPNSVSMLVGRNSARAFWLRR